MAYATTKNPERYDVVKVEIENGDLSEYTLNQLERYLPEFTYKVKKDKVQIKLIRYIQFAQFKKHVETLYVDNNDYILSHNIFTLNSCFRFVFVVSDTVYKIWYNHHVEQRD